MSTDSTKKTIGVALGVCLVCSILVSSAAVSLHSIQEKNKRLDRFKNILAAAGLDSLSGDVVDIYNEKVDPIIIDLSSGEPVPESEYDEMLDPATFNIQALADNPQYSESVPDNEDIAGINRRPKVMAVYQVKSEGQVQKFVLPIYGKGLWSTLYGFITLDRDLNTEIGRAHV
jgi:Na+-transporting NADH:ubiquinone oxidoreductase subunit C